MKRLFKQAGFNPKKVNLKKDGDSHTATINNQYVSDADGSSPMLHDDSDIKTNHINREELNNTMKAVSQAVESTRGITGRHDNNQLADYDGQLGIGVVERLSVFTNAVQKIADVATYTQGIDQDMQDLFETLDSTYKFIEDTKEIENVPAHERILTDIAKQTVDCAYFIRAYAKNTNFWIRAGKNLIGRPITPRVQMYKDAFAKLLAQFQIHSALHTEIATSHIQIAVGRLLESNQSLKVSLDLDGLPYVGGAGLQIGKQCLAGTRTEVLDEIVDWINDANDNCPRLFWLAGPAGVGKSAIAHSIASRFKSIGRLGSFFCFDKNDSTKRRGKVFSTIARDLADLDLEIKHQLAEVIQNDTSLRNTTDMQLQWRNFILRPLQVTSKFSTGPIVVVIDALDESGDPSSRQELLNILAKEVPSLPPNVRFLVTSRSERDISRALNKPSQFYVRSKLMDTIPEIETNRDILTYFRVELTEEGSCAFEDAQLRQLVNLSQGLFQWAYLASQFLRGLGNTAGLTIAERYQDLINVQRIDSINDPLDAMYTQILSSLFNPNDPRVINRFHSIIGSILAASESLSLNNLVVLRGDNIPPSKRETDIKEVIQHMGALLSGISDPSSSIRPLHLSFCEYLLDKNRSRGYCVNLAPCHQGLAYGCLRTMMEGLKFNICNISTSHRRNTDDKNLPKRISSLIPIPLSYSCRFWATHVTSAAFDRSLATKTEGFLYRGFLLWLEVLSLLRAVNMAVKSMSNLMTWSSREESHKALYNFVTDGKQFVRLFIDVIAMSAPHIYISALPFCPQDSIIYQNFIDHFPNTLQIASKPILGWPIFHQRPSVGEATCICFSHEGEYLAVGLIEPFGNAFRLLDAETLDVFWTIEVPEDRPICAIEFYTSDKSLVFATDLQVYQFDILSGSLTNLHKISPFTQTCFEKFSQNAKFVTSVGEDCLTVWNLQNQECVIEIPWQKSFHSGYSFSTNGGDILVTYLVSAGVQVLDLQTGAILPGLSRPDIFIFSRSSTLPEPYVSPNGIDIIFLHPHRVYSWNFRDNHITNLKHSGYQGDRILAISPNGDYCAMAKGSESTRVFLCGNGSRLNYKVLKIACNAFSKDGRRFAINESRDGGGYLKICELYTKQERPYKFDSSPRVNSRFMHPVASPARNYHFFSKMEHKYEIRDAKLNQPTCQLSLENPILLPTFSPMNRYFSWIFYEGTAANVHDLDSGTIKKFDSGHKQATIRSLVSSQDDTLMATLAVNVSQKTLHICTWDIDSSKIVNTLTIPDVMFDLNQYPTFKASSSFRYFAYSLSNELFLYSDTSRPIPLDFLHSSLHDNFAFDLDEKHILVTRGRKVFYMNLITNEHQSITINDNCFNQAPIQIYPTSSGVLLFEASTLGLYTGEVSIWNPFTGELRSDSQSHPSLSVPFVDFPSDRLFFVTLEKVPRAAKASWKLKIKLKKDHWLGFSCDKKHSIQSFCGPSATLERDGWVITKNIELLFWLPNEYREALGLGFLVEGESLELDLNSFAHGEWWTDCRNA